jgi:ketosteroid isomerase-like protein
MTKEEIVRSYYASWEKKDWAAMDRLLADSFTFTSPNDDDHISKAAFKERCWVGQVQFIERFELVSLSTNHAEAFVKYLCRRTQGTSFHNVEHFQFAGEQIAAIEVYFGERLGYPSADSSPRNDSTGRKAPPRSPRSHKPGPPAGS